VCVCVCVCVWGSGGVWGGGGGESSHSQRCTTARTVAGWQTAVCARTMSLSSASIAMPGLFSTSSCAARASTFRQTQAPRLQSDANAQATVEV
jgi:hypothetical protein